MLDWHPEKREILVRQRRGNVSQLHRVAEPGAAPEPLTDYPDAVAGGRYEPRAGSWLLLSRAAGGDEAFRLHRHDPVSKEAVPVSPEGVRAGAPAWNRKGDRMVFATLPLDRNNATREAKTTVHLADPQAPDKARILAVLPGGGWSSFRFSPDDRRLVLVERVSAEESHLWLMEVANGKMRRITPAKKGTPVHYGDPQFSPDGKALFAISDRGSEYRHVAWIDLATGREQALAANLKHDVEDISLSAKAKSLAFVTNEAGAHVLRFIDIATRKETPRPALVSGVISGLHWRRDGSEIAFTHASARSPGDVFSYHLGENRVTRWTNGNSPSLNAAAFPEPRIIRWKSFDGREITGLYYHPPSQFEGVRPVVVSVHGGPASQARAGFIGRNNYLVNELGIAVIYPNVRGSSGFGKTFLALDNGRLREDSVKDLGALLDWIRTQPGLDADRVLVTGGSYGGYMALAAAVHYSERIAGAIASVGISSFVTFLERTETYRRDLRRVEYGDERDPEMRAFLEVHCAPEPRREDRQAALRGAGQERSARALDGGRADRGGPQAARHAGVVPARERRGARVPEEGQRRLPVPRHHRVHPAHLAAAGQAACLRSSAQDLPGRPRNTPPCLPTSSSSCTPPSCLRGRRPCGHVGRRGARQALGEEPLVPRAAPGGDRLRGRAVGAGLHLPAHDLGGRAARHGRRARDSSSAGCGRCCTGARRPGSSRPSTASSAPSSRGRGGVFLRGAARRDRACAMRRAARESFPVSLVQLPKPLLVSPDNAKRSPHTTQRNR